MPLNAGGGDGPGKFVLVFVSAFVEEVDFVGSCDSDRGVYGNVAHCYPDDTLVVPFEVPDLGLREKTHELMI